MKNRKLYLVAMSLVGMLLLYSCQATDNSNSNPNPVEGCVEYTPITMQQIAMMQQVIDGLVPQTGAMNVAGIERTRTLKGIGAIGAADTAVRVFKISFDTPNPKGMHDMIKCSGVLLVPKSQAVTYRVLVTAPPTYTLNSMAASNFFKDFQANLLPPQLDGAYHYLYAMQASSGFAVFIPDYAGFGDSFGKCFSPYVVHNAQAVNTIDFIKAGEKALTGLGYTYNPKILVSGYSQGAFVAASVVQELETDDSYGIPVQALATGGTPCNLKTLLDEGRLAPSLSNAMFLPYLYYGFKENGLLDMDDSSMMKEPYATNALGYFDGTEGIDVINSHFPQTTSAFLADGMLTPSAVFDKDPTYRRLNQVLAEHSLRTWVNYCEFRMYHGTSDVTVSYDQANTFALQQNSAGGSVQMIPIPLATHTTAIYPYIVAVNAWFAEYQ